MMTWPEHHPTLVEGDLTLRPWQDSDAEAVYLACQDPVIQEYTTVPVPYTRERAKEFIATRGLFPVGGNLAFAMMHGDELAGSMGLHDFRLHDHIAELGYWVAPGKRGLGLAVRGARLVCDYGFSLGLRRIVALVLPENEASRRTAMAAGFELETIHRQGMTRRDGSQTDALVFARFPAVRI